MYRGHRFESAYPAMEVRVQRILAELAQVPEMIPNAIGITCKVGENHYPFALFSLKGLSKQQRQYEKT